MKEPREEKGTGYEVFSLRPIQAGASRQAALDSGSQKPPDQNNMTSRGAFEGQTLLYVEDDPILAKETFARLGLMGFAEIRVAHDLCQFEFLVRDFRFDVALLDVHLGLSTTIDVAAQLAETGARIVFTSGYDRTELGDRLGDFPFLAKPYTFGQLSLALESTGEEQMGSLAAE